jgi:hypothetical protein
MDLENYLQNNFNAYKMVKPMDNVLKTARGLDFSSDIQSKIRRTNAALRGALQVQDLFSVFNSLKLDELKNPTGFDISISGGDYPHLQIQNLRVSIQDNGVLVFESSSGYLSLQEKDFVGAVCRYLLDLKDVELHASES